VRIGIDAGLVLLLLPFLVVVSVRLVQPGDPIVAQIIAAETVLIAAAQVAISIRVIRRTPTPGIVRALIPASIAGLVVAAGELASSSVAFASPSFPKAPHSLSPRLDARSASARTAALSPDGGEGFE